MKDGGRKEGKKEGRGKAMKMTSEDDIRVYGQTDKYLEFFISSTFFISLSLYLHAYFYLFLRLLLYFALV